MDNNYIVNTRYFTYFPKDRVFASENSCLPHTNMSRYPHINLVSERTGKIIKCLHVWTEKDLDNDVRYWKYYNQENDITVQIFND